MVLKAGFGGRDRESPATLSVFQGETRMPAGRMLGYVVGGTAESLWVSGVREPRFRLQCVAPGTRRLGDGAGITAGLGRQMRPDDRELHASPPGCKPGDVCALR